MKRYVVSGVLISTLLVPVAHALTKTDTTQRSSGPLTQLPGEVTQGSINARGQQDSGLYSLAKLPIRDALQIAELQGSGPITEIDLRAENGYVIWDVTQVQADGAPVELKIDAGTGQLLAANFPANDDADTDRPAKHPLWKFWEDDDDDDNRLSTRHDIKD